MGKRKLHFMVDGKPLKVDIEAWKAAGKKFTEVTGIPYTGSIAHDGAKFILNTIKDHEDAKYQYLFLEALNDCTPVLFDNNLPIPIYLDYKKYIDWVIEKYEIGEIKDSDPLFSPEGVIKQQFEKKVRLQRYYDTVLKPQLYRDNTDPPPPETTPPASEVIEKTVPEKGKTVKGLHLNLIEYALYCFYEGLPITREIEGQYLYQTYLNWKTDKERYVHNGLQKKKEWQIKRIKKVLPLITNEKGMQIADNDLLKLNDSN